MRRGSWETEGILGMKGRMYRKEMGRIILAVPFHLLVFTCRPCECEAPVAAAEDLVLFIFHAHIINLTFCVWL